MDSIQRALSATARWFPLNGELQNERRRRKNAKHKEMCVQSYSVWRSEFVMIYKLNAHWNFPVAILLLYQMWWFFSVVPCANILHASNRFECNHFIYFCFLVFNFHVLFIPHSLIMSHIFSFESLSHHGLSLVSRFFSLSLPSLSCSVSFCHIHFGFT